MLHTIAIGYRLSIMVLSVCFRRARFDHRLIPHSRSFGIHRSLCVLQHARPKSHVSIVKCCPAVPAMLPRVLAIANYVGAYKRMGSADASAKVQADQAEHVMLLLKSEVLDVYDAAALITDIHRYTLSAMCTYLARSICDHRLSIGGPRVVTQLSEGTSKVCWWFTENICKQ